jgi:hypothetical protein
MPDLTASDVTIALSLRNIEDRPGMLRRVFPNLTFGNGALTYPAGGIPLPAKEQFGFRKALVHATIQGPVNAYVYKYDLTNHKLLIYQGGSPTNPPTQTALAEVTGVAIASVTLRMEFVGE